jgi:hypothetical protein
MPYITTDKREEIDEGRFPVSAGELNYLLTQSILCYLQYQGQNYQTVNDIIGALEGCKLEFYRRFVAKYEDLKIEENGDVY